MHSIWTRANAVFAFTLSVLAAVTFAAFASTAFSETSTAVSITAANPRIKALADYGSTSRAKSDVAMLDLSVTVDISPIFNWNVKQLFLYLVAEYSSATNPVNQVVLWDKIVRRGESTFVQELQVPPKYYFIDDGNNLLDHPNVTLVMRWNVIPNAGYLALAQGSGQHVLKMPATYITGKF